TLDKELLDLFARETYLTRDLYDIEALGIMIDQEFLESSTAKIDQELEKLLGNICTTAGMEGFNPRSNPQKRELMENLKINPVKQGKTGPSWDREALMAVRHKHPVALEFARYQALAYQRSGLIERAIKSRGFMHGEFKNWGTVTGRLSSNLQQLPKGWLQFGESAETGDDVLVWLKDELAKEKEFSIRRLVRPRPGKVLFKADYSQIEMFVLAFYMKDKTFDSWLDSGNVHAAAAEEVFGDPVKDYDKGKTYNFATVYGQGDKARARALGCSEEESKEYKVKYDAKMPGHQKFLKRVRKSLRKNGYVDNVFGRRYYQDPDVAYRALNYLCQGSAGDFVKFELPFTRTLRQQLGIDIIITTHDDFIFEMDEENISRLPEWLEELRHSPFNRELGLEADFGRISLVALTPFKEFEYAT
ncbi:MAG: DNA polymerase A family protein, partial [Nitrosopumilus sp.]